MLQCIYLKQLLVLQINKQTMLTEEISSNDGMSNIGQDKLPVEVFPEAKVEGASVGSKGGDESSICNPQRESLLLCAAITCCGWKHTNFSTQINQVTLARGTVINKKKTTNVTRSNDHHHWSSGAFLTMENGGLHLVAHFPNQA